MTNLVVDGARQIVTATRRARHARLRRLPTLRLTERPGLDQRIYYVSPDPPTPRGGVRVFYRHVDVLNQAGFYAAVVHSRKNYRATWFENQTKIVGGQQVELATRDILVVPEYYGPVLGELPDGPTVVIFNQGAYHTFDAIPVKSSATLLPRQVASILTVSEDSKSLLRNIFPELTVDVAHTVVDGRVFFPGHRTPSQRRRIGYLTNRRPEERHQLLSILSRRGQLSDWEIVPISGMPEKQVADTLRSCAIFLSFSEREGFGLPPAEAMACGCYVIGYHGQGGREYFDPAYCSIIADGDLLAYATEIEKVVARFDSDPDAITSAGLTASRAILQRYTLDALREDLVTFYSRLGLTAGTLL